MALAAVKWAISSRTILKHLFPIQNGALYCVCHKTTYSSLPDDYNCKVELALTSDGRTIVCYHPSVDIPYEHTKFRASLVAQWLRICLPMQGTRVRALVWEDPTCRGATGPVSHNY
ncbi:large ribosomal subunit protein mL42 isoform 4-T10 [Megaptera novaeangliae]